jgi:hypothetical protein
MRPRIKRTIDIQSVIDCIEYRVSVYSQCIKYIMNDEQVEYKQAKLILNRRLANKVIFKY